jgi:hypothetical protein
MEAVYYRGQASSITNFPPKAAISYISYYPFYYPAGSYIASIDSCQRYYSIVASEFSRKDLSSFSFMEAAAVRPRRQRRNSPLEPACFSCCSSS